MSFTTSQSRVFITQGTLSNRPQAARRGFTLIELLTVIAIIGILAAILIPTVSKVRESSKKARCVGNVRQITLSLINQANQTKNNLFPTNTAGNFSWDISHSVVEDLVGSAGRQVLYCPSSKILDAEPLERMYKFSSNYAVTSYVLLIPGTKLIVPSLVNTRMQSSYKVAGATSFLELGPSQRILVQDVVISSSTSPDSFANVQTGALSVNVSNHMNGSLPSGAHSGFVDGHVKWRPFKINPGTTPVGTTTDGFSRGNNGTPIFWF